MPKVAGGLSLVRAHFGVRLLAALQAFLLLGSLLLPALVFAEEPPATPDPAPTEQPSEPPPDPTPSAPDPTAAPETIPDPAPQATPPPTEPTATPDPTTAPDPTVTPPVADRAWVVSFVAGTSALEQSDSITGAGATTTDTIGALRIHAVDASDASVDLLRANPLVASVELDRSRVIETVPDDNAYAEQWALPKIGWDLAYGTISPTGSAVVAILDTGVDASHPDLDGNIVSGTSFVVGSSWSSDPNGHGTSMAGIVAAETNNALGIAGVGYAGVSVMPVTVLDADGLGRDSDIIEGVVWATDHGADVILMAFSAYGYSSALQAAVDYAWSRDVVLVASVGNDGLSTPAFPAGDAGVIGVSATDSSDALASFSNTRRGRLPRRARRLDPNDGRHHLRHLGGCGSCRRRRGPAFRGRSSASNGVIVGRLARNADAVAPPPRPATAG